MAIRISLSDSSLTSLIPSIFLSILIFSIFLTKLALFTAKGISVIIICSFPLFLLISYFDLINTFPLPLVYASSNPFLGKHIPPVGKSGPFTISRIVSK